jgi:hypothetical protein
MDSHQVEGQERCAFDEVMGLPWVKVSVTGSDTPRTGYPGPLTGRAGLVPAEAVVPANCGHSWHLNMRPYHVQVRVESALAVLITA